MVETRDASMSLTDAPHHPRSEPGGFAPHVGLLERSGFVIAQLQVEGGDSVGPMVLFGYTNNGCVDHGFFSTQASRAGRCHSPKLMVPMAILLILRPDDRGACNPIRLLDSCRRS